MANVLVDQTENEKCGQLKVDWKFGCCGSRDGRRVAYLQDRNFWLLDLFHMTQKKFSISFDCLPTSLLFVCFQALHWFYEDKALVVFMVLKKGTRELEEHFAIMDIDCDRLHCVLRDVQFLDKKPERCSRNIVCRLIPLPNGIGIVWMSLSGKPTLLDVFSNSVDCEPKFTKSILFPESFCPMGAIDGLIYGYIKGLSTYIDPRKLVKICMETNKQTTLDVKSPEESVRFARDHYWVQVGRKFVASCLAHRPPGEEDRRKRLFIFDVDSRRWTESGCRFKERINQMIYDEDNTLIVMKRSPGESYTTCNFYRFAINRPDTLANSSWMAIRNHAKKSPGFDRYVLQLLPKNSPFHCALGIRLPLERPASSTFLTFDSTKKTRD